MPRQPRNTGLTTIGSLYGQALMRLARAVGLHHAGLAVYLGLERSNVSPWASGKEPIPPTHLLLIAKRLQEALGHALARADGPSKAELATILNDVFRENLAALGFPTYPTLRALLAQLTTASQAFAATKDPTPAQHAELKVLAGALNFCTLIINDIAELLGMLDCPELRFLSGAAEDFHDDHDREEHHANGGAEGVPRIGAGASGEDLKALD